MPFTPEEKRDILARCTKFLGHHYPKSAEQMMQEIIDSPSIRRPKDFYGRGGFVSEFEAEIAELLGKEAAVFMPSGTMAQQIALRIWCDRVSCNRVAFHPTCHLEIHEQGAYRELHHLEATLLGERSRLFTLDDLQKIGGRIAALLIELPQREIGGQLPTLRELQDLCTWAKERDVRLHLDGARLWECQPFYNRSYAEIAAPFDSVYVSFYKILNALPGAILAGPADFIEEARIWQRRHGGNLFQLFPNAISAKVGLDRHLLRLPAYCAKAATLAAALQTVEGVRVVPEHPLTNMMHLHLTGDREALEQSTWEIAAERGILLFGGLGSTDKSDVWKTELSIAEPALELAEEEVAALFTELLERSNSEVVSSY